MKIKLAALTALCLLLLSADDGKKKKWDVSNPPGDYKDVSFTVTEGTWMNLDVSPDGKTIAFDLLGDIYSMPVTGGTATVLQDGHAWQCQPRFSPDGKSICFTSDAGGGDNIWMMDADGKNAKQITKENFRLLNNAIWSSDGQYIIARKHFSSTRSLGSGEMWMYHTSGGDGVQLTKKKNAQQDVNEPSLSPDGQYLYYSEDMYPGGAFQYNKDPNNQIYVVNRYNTKTGETEFVTGGPGGACRPQISHDGKQLAFIRRVQEKTVLYIRDLATGLEWPVYDDLSKDQQEAWCIFGVYTGFNWMPDNKHIIIWSKGKIMNVDVATNKGVEIPFSVTCNHRIYNALHFKNDAAPDKFDAKMVRNTVVSPDGKWMVFNAAGYLYKKSMPNGTPVRLTKGTDFEFEPAFSSDGSKIAFVTWNDENTGAIITTTIASATAPVKITKEKGIFRQPSFSPDGKTIAFWKEGGNDHQGYAFCVKPGIYTVPASGGDATFLFDNGAQKPTFSSDGKNIFYYVDNGDSKELDSYDLNKKTSMQVATSPYAWEITPSPDNKWIAFRELFKVYVAAFPATGKSLDLSRDMSQVPMQCITRDAGQSICWSGDSKKIWWTMGENYFSREISQTFDFLPNAPDSLPAMDTVGTPIGLTLTSDKPKGTVALTNARIITVNAKDEVIENGTVVVTENKIVAVGKTGDVQIPAGAKVIDCAGKTIMPGIVDVHAHLGTFRQGLSPQKQWSYYANLAFGVTTTHDPSSNTEMVFSQAEAVRAGTMVGPRIFSTGWILYGAEGDFKAVINNYDDARSAVYRTKACGAFSVKSYNQPRREQRQQVITAARNLNMEVVPEGGSFFYHNMTEILDGHTGIEHNIPVAPVYDDVIKLWSASGTGYTPTLIVCYGAMMGENYWYQHTNVWENQRLLEYYPRGEIDSRSRHRTMVPEEDFTNGYILVSQSVKKLADAGVKVNLGAHGQLQGLGAHWELWMLAQGGMSPLQAIRCATMNGASYIGMDSQIGSLEVGKLADLIVIDKNPLEDIHNSQYVDYTMINGRIYDCATMNEVGNYDKKRAKFWWEANKYAPVFDWHEQTNSFMEDNCGDVD
ncbi:MAG TPA: amidohydrolase family protein [Bacteroidia bacterium]|jgi:imidazolonepropionase-like amidohydrolase/Tol biopolymer transport system component|nr:amidohydrolase family protein [Bacteroidia bacterium]